MKAFPWAWAGIASVVAILAILANRSITADQQYAVQVADSVLAINDSQLVRIRQYQVDSVVASNRRRQDSLALDSLASEAFLLAQDARMAQGEARRSAEALKAHLRTDKDRSLLSDIMQGVELTEKALGACELANRQCVSNLQAEQAAHDSTRAVLRQTTDVLLTTSQALETARNAIPGRPLLTFDGFAKGVSMIGMGAVIALVLTLLVR